MCQLLKVKSTKLVVGTKTQLVKLGKISICYPCIICSSVEHRCGECPKKIEVQNMFKTKSIGYNVTITPKLPKMNNVLINVVDVITIHNQQSEQ